MCQNIEKNMSQINDQRTTFALEQINQDLKVCLPLMDLAEQKQLMQRSTEMYQRFLKVDRTEFQQRAFEQYALEMAQHRIVELMEEATYTAETIETDPDVAAIAKALEELDA